MQIFHLTADLHSNESQSALNIMPLMLCHSLIVGEPVQKDKQHCLLCCSVQDWFVESRRYYGWLTSSSAHLRDYEV